MGFLVIFIIILLFFTQSSIQQNIDPFEFDSENHTDAIRLETCQRMLELERNNKMVELALMGTRFSTKIAELNQTINFLTVGNWTYFGKTKHLYKVFDERLEFDEAQVFCVAQNGHLASIHSQEENDFVLGLVKANNVFGEESTLWIGLKRRNGKVGNPLEWTDGSAVDFTNWSSNETNPDTHGYISDGSSGKWSLYASVRRLFVCKRKKENFDRNAELKSMLSAVKANKTTQLETDLNQRITFLAWTYFPMTNSFYKAIDRNFEHDKAEAFCVERNGHLASIHSQEENDFVWGLAKDLDSRNGFWIGLQRNPRKKFAIEWTDGSAVDFANWHDEEPDRRLQGKISGTSGTWRFTLTDFYPFICKTSSPF